MAGMCHCAQAWKQPSNFWGKQSDELLQSAKSRYEDAMGKATSVQDMFLTLFFNMFKHVKSSWLVVKRERIV